MPILRSRWKNAGTQSKEEPSMSKVFIVKCDDYGRVEKKLDELLEAMGGMQRFVKPGQRIVLKPNLLMAAAPPRAITTHPSLVAAIGKSVGTITRNIELAESPGAGYSYDRKSLEKTYRLCGMVDAAQEASITLSYDTSFETVPFPDGTLVKRFDIIRPIRACDGYINVCKLKTHALTFMTGAVKNTFGIIPGRTKTGYHGTLTKRGEFAGMLFDLMALAPPKLAIMDAVIGMEGEGPGGGSPRPVGLLIASTDPLALDIVASEIMGVPQDRNPLLIEAKRRGMHPCGIDEVETVGMRKEELRIQGFKLPTSLTKDGFRLLKFVAPVAKALFTVDPRVITAACVACGACRNACPRDAIAMRTVAKIDRKKCIRCYCCHEMCNYHAIELHRSLLYRLVNKPAG
jgi:uncharacterized protein (DUF362 family)/NAD-dependent dihydropyrimidine dehydrogenase PreA subunit